MKRSLITALISIIALANPCLAEPGVSPEGIVLGQSCALTGPASELGTKMKAGLEAAFAEANAAGGVKGRKLELISKDDGYEPDAAIKNVRELIEDGQVFLLIGEVGTPTSKAVVPLAEEARVPFFAPFTGAEFLRNPFKKYVINVRGSYYQEMEKLAEYLSDRKGMKKIACFYQNDSYGQAGLAGIQKALEKRGMELAATSTYERNTTAVKSGLLKIRAADPEAVVMVGAYKPCAEFIKLARKVGMKDTVFCNISFVGTGGLKAELEDQGEGCIISQVVTYPWDTTVPLVAKYTEAMKKYQPDVSPGFVSLEGYMGGALLVMALNELDGPPTRESLIEAIENKGTFDLGGITLSYGPQDHQGMDEVFLTVIRDGEVVPLED